MKSATVYRRHDGWYLHAVSKTTVGMGMGTPPYLKLENDASSDALGKAALQALAGAREGVPHPTPEEADNEPWPMLELAGVKSWAAFAKRASNVGVSTDNEWLIIEPWKNEGAKMGFVPIPGVAFRVRSDAPPAEIGDAIRKAIAVSAAQAL